MLSREPLIPQLSDEVGADAIRVYVEISGVAGSERSSENRERMRLRMVSLTGWSAWDTDEKK